MLRACGASNLSNSFCNSPTPHGSSPRPSKTWSRDFWHALRPKFTSPISPISVDRPSGELNDQKCTGNTRCAWRAIPKFPTTFHVPERNMLARLCFPTVSLHSIMFNLFIHALLLQWHVVVSVSLWMHSAQEPLWKAVVMSCMGCGSYGWSRPEPLPWIGVVNRGEKTNTAQFSISNLMLDLKTMPSGGTRLSHATVMHHEFGLSSHNSIEKLYLARHRRQARMRPATQNFL